MNYNNIINQYGITLDTLFIEWVEPFQCENLEFCRTVRISIFEAIQMMKLIASKEKQYSYKTNMDALNDAIAINWATLIEEKKSDDGNTVEYRRILDIQENLREEINRGRR